MRHLHYIEIENFKTFGGKQKVELGHPAVLIGPNNSGKTSVIQAIALWSQAVRAWQTARTRSEARERPGTPLNRLSIVNVPVQRTRFFWHDTKVRTGNTDIPLTITAGVEHAGKVTPVTIQFRNQGEDLIYCKLDESIRSDTELIAHAAKLSVELLYPMSGLEAEEPVLQKGRIDVLLGQGQTAQVLRNLCLTVYRDAPDDWKSITGWMERLFRLKLGTPAANARGAIDLVYEQPGVKEPLELTSSGRGFQQMLLIFAYLYSHKDSVLLVDEPDAHLEILRQKQVFVLLRDIARDNRSQVVLATHSEVILDAALENNLTLLLDGRADNLAKRPSIRESLKIFGATHYVRARQRGHVLYVEGETDIAILRALSAKLNHRAAGAWDENPNVFFVENVHPEPGLEGDLERVEGGSGVKPKDHFYAVRKLLPGLRGLAILDNDGRGQTDRDEAGLAIRYWRRYEIENYFITPDLLLEYVARSNIDLDLFAIERPEAAAVMDELVEERIFGGDRGDWEVWKNSPPDAARLVWEAKTRHIKLSTFAEDFFRGLAQRTGFAMLLTKGEFHRLVQLVDPKSIHKEVHEKLDLLADLFQAAGPLPSSD